MMLDTTPPRDFYESRSDDEEADIFQQIDEWISALEEVSDDDLRSWIDVLEERARDGPRDNEEVGWLKAMKDEMAGRNPYESSPGFRVLIDPDTYPDTWWAEKSLEQKKAVVLAQDGGGEREIPVWVQQLAGVIEAVCLVAGVDLPQPDIDARGRHFPQRAPQVRAGGLAGLESACLAGDIQGPRPGRSPSAQLDAAFLQGHGVQHGGGNAGVVRGQLIGRRRNLPCLGGRDPDGEEKQAERARAVQAH